MLMPPPEPEFHLFSAALSSPRAHSSHLHLLMLVFIWQVLKPSLGFDMAEN